MQGEGVTSGLRKVTDDMKTKNRADRSGVVPALPSAAAAAATTSAPAAAGRLLLHNGSLKRRVHIF